MLDNLKEYILCAAIKLRGVNNNTAVISGFRHVDIIIQLNKLGIYLDHPGDIDIDCHWMGFLTSKNRFVTRSDAYKIALEANQIEEKELSRLLISEDLY
jgi:hypothetical protein